MIYATINKDGIVTGVSQLAGKVEKDGMIAIAEYDESLLGKKYDKGKFMDSGIVKPVYVDPVIAKLDEIIKLLKG